MKQSEIFHHVFLIMTDSHPGGAIPVEAVALASYAKSHRISNSNAFDVLNVLYAQSEDEGMLFEVHCRPPADDPQMFQSQHDVVFPDGSTGLVIAYQGIGTEYEVTN